MPSVLRTTAVKDDDSAGIRRRLSLTVPTGTTLQHCSNAREAATVAVRQSSTDLWSYTEPFQRQQKTGYYQSTDVPSSRRRDCDFDIAHSHSVCLISVLVCSLAWRSIVGEAENNKRAIESTSPRSTSIVRSLTCSPICML